MSVELDYEGKPIVGGWPGDDAAPPPRPGRRVRILNDDKESVTITEPLVYHHLCPRCDRRSDIDISPDALQRNKTEYEVYRAEYERDAVFAARLARRDSAREEAERAIAAQDAAAEAEQRAFKERIAEELQAEQDRWDFQQRHPEAILNRPPRN